MTAYAELQITSNFSFLRGGSHPEELVLRAQELGLEALALTDRNTLAGVVRAHVAAKEVGLRFVVGARLDLEPERRTGAVIPLARSGVSRLSPSGLTRGSTLHDGAMLPARSVLCFPTDRAAYGRLAQLISQGQRRVEKGRCALGLEDLLAHGEGQIVVALPPDQLDDGFAAFLDKLRHSLPGCHLAAQHLYRGDDAARIEALADLAAACRIAAGRDRRRALPRARAPAAPGRAHLHPRALHDRSGGLSARGQRRAPSQAAGRDGAPVPPPSRTRSRAPPRSSTPAASRSRSCATTIRSIRRPRASRSSSISSS